ncbi:hypothetical protein [Lacisediminihabitans sp.]|uniref:hypothetical protein n=1 Tax=Lacisediminihabitans sp. TaxID=2787631 RepID=UPI00374CE07F
MDDEHAEPVERQVRELLARTIGALDAAGVKDEALAILRPSRGFSVFRTAEAMVPAGRAWRLGVLLLDRSGSLFATGSVTRAVEPGRVTNQSPAAELRRAARRTASRGPFARGDVVNFGFVPLALDAGSLRAGSGPLALVDDSVLVRWGGADGQGVSTLAAYLADRVSLHTAD